MLRYLIAIVDSIKIITYLHDKYLISIHTSQNILPTYCLNYVRNYMVNCTLYKNKFWNLESFNLDAVQLSYRVSWVDLFEHKNVWKCILIYIIYPNLIAKRILYREYYYYCLCNMFCPLYTRYAMVRKIAD